MPEHVPAEASPQVAHGFKGHLPRWPGPELRMLARAWRSHRRRLDQPFKLTFAVTYACQSGCRICSIWKKRPQGELSAGEIRKILASAPQFSWIDLTGGEPFLRDDLEEIAAAVLEECPGLALLHLPTNGLDPQRVEQAVRRILAMDPRRFIMTVSIDGPPELNVALRGHPEAWTAALDTFARLRRLRSAVFDVLIGITISEANATEAGAVLGEARKVIPDLRREELHWNLAQESSHYYANDLDELGSQALERYAQLQSLAGDRAPLSLGGKGLVDRLRPVPLIDRRYRDHLGSFVRTGRSPVPCRALWSTAFLDPNGRLYPCITWDRPLGNLRDCNYDLVSLWQSEQVIAASREVAEGRCPQCWTACEAVPSMLGSLQGMVGR